MSETIDLLFFDTFAHENCEELNLDLVQFPKPVYVTEVRIIPLGARVQADFPGGVRLGATNPSQFSIEFFVNDLGKPGASTFETLGGFEYNQNGCINLECIRTDTTRKVPTDGLVLRGWYTTITLAVYGILTGNITEQLIPPIVPPSLPPQATTLPEVQPILPVNTIKTEWGQENLQPVSIEYTQQPAVAYAQSYGNAEQFPQEYSDYYNEVPKDPRSYNTPESDWDNKSRGRSIEADRDNRDRSRERDRYQKSSNLEHEHSRDSDRRDRDRHYSSHSHSQDKERQGRDYKDSGRDSDRNRDRDWDHDRNSSYDYRDHSDKDRDRDRDRESDRSYKHQDSYRRSYNREDRERDDVKKRPRTPPTNSPKRPHTPHNHVEIKEKSPTVKETLSNEDIEQQRTDRDRQVKNQNEKLVSKDIQESHTSLNEEPISMDVEEFEPILSDEDILDDAEHFQDLDYDYTAYTNTDDLIKFFVPGSTLIHKYSTNSVFSVNDNIVHVKESFKSLVYVTDDFIRSSITKYKLHEFENLNSEIKEEFIHLCEKFMQTVENSDNFCKIVSLYTILNNKNSIGNIQDTFSQVKSITKTLIDWIKIALDFDMANAQSQPANKIRHIKCGVRLGEWCCASINFIELLWHENYSIDKILLNLYNQEYMALSIKLMILRALDAYILHKKTMERFIFNNRPLINGSAHIKVNSNSEDSGYKTLIKIICQNPSARLKFALQSILRKINLFETLRELHSATDTLYKGIEKSQVHARIELIGQLLNHTLQLYRNGAFLVSQPKRFMPVSAQFEINRLETKNSFLNLFKMFNLLDCFNVLLMLEDTFNTPSVIFPIFGVLSELLVSNEGLDYLLENSDSVNIFLKYLLQNEETMHFSSQFSLEYKAHILGLRIAYKLQCRYHVDCLLDLGDKHNFDCDSFEIIEQLHNFYCLTFSYVGKISCSQVLGYQQNIQCLLQFLDILLLKDKSEQQLIKIKKSLGICYIIDLISVVVIHAINIPFLERYSKTFLQIVSNRDLFESSVVTKINEFSAFLNPFETITSLNYDNMNPIMDVINKNMESVTSCSGQLITCLKILQYLGISNYENKSNILTDNPFNIYSELKYKHVIIQLFSMDSVSIFTKILEKVCQHYEQPILHSNTFVSCQGIQILNIIVPCVNLLNQILTYVIHCRNTNFKDLTTVPILLQTYNLLRSYPNSSPVYSISHKICEKIIDTLLVYTQPVSNEINENDSLNKTLWSMMCGEVIKYLNLAPYTLISGLLVFSELLPLPLPIQTRESLTHKEITWAVNLRKLWSAHLHSYSSSIQELINRLCMSTNHSLLNLLRKVCIQLSDLAANSSIMIARGVLDSIYNNLESEDENNTLQPCNSNTARLLNLLACLVTHNSFKCAVSHLLHSNANVSKCDEKYPLLVLAFTKVIALTNNTSTHVQAQECILSIIQSLCDTEITLVQNSTEKKCVNSDIYLANSLPCKENLIQFIVAILDYLNCENSFLACIQVLRILLLLNEHDYGFYHLREHLLKRDNLLLNILNKIVNTFSKDNEECLSTLNTLMEFLRVCLKPEEITEPVFLKLRTMKLTTNEVKNLIGWQSFEENKNQQHPLCNLKSLLKKTFEEDNHSESYLLDAVSNILILLEKDDDVKEIYSEPILPPPNSLLVQFDNRQIFTLSDVVDEQLTSAYWLSTPADQTELNSDTENITCDVSDICRQNLPVEVNLIREVEKLCRIYPSTNADQENNKSKGTDSQKTKNKKTFVAPLARRGFLRSVQARGDLFRSRPPNTSRPPSLHVDDFVALETCGAQPTGPTGYNKISRELLATSRIARGSRGRAFPSSERAVQYRQMSWWSTGLGRTPYH